VFSKINYQQRTGFVLMKHYSNAEFRIFAIVNKKRELKISPRLNQPKPN
jgi:hypothetical protein